MGVQYSKEQVRQRFCESIDQKKPILVAGAGMGITAKFAEQGGADMISIDLTGLFRVDAVPSIASILPYADANTTVLGMIKRIYPNVREIPVMAGISASDPTVQPEQLLKCLKGMGISAVANSPSIGYYINRERNDFEDAHMGVNKEAEVLGIASEMGFYTVGYVYDIEGARLMGMAGIDALVCDFRLTAGGSIGIDSAKHMNLNEAATLVNALDEAAEASKKNMILLLHGGPVQTPQDTLYLYKRTKAKGIVAGSVIERLPVEDAIREATRAFKNIKIKKRVI